MKNDKAPAETPRELGTENVDGRRHEVRPDGSIAYFGDNGEEDVDRELAEAGIPAREVGTPKEDQ